MLGLCHAAENVGKANALSNYQTTPPPPKKKTHTSPSKINASAPKGQQNIAQGSALGNGRIPPPLT